MPCSVACRFWFCNLGAPGKHALDFYPHSKNAQSTDTNTLLTPKYKEHPGPSEISVVTDIMQDSFALPACSRRGARALLRGTSGLGDIA